MTNPTRTPRPGPTRRRQPTAQQSSIPRSARGRAPQRPARQPRASQTATDENWKLEFAWRWWLIAAVVVFVALVIAVLKAPFFAIGPVQLSGEARTSEGAVLAALDLAEDQALATFDLDDAEARVGELPWVESVSITRGWPSTLRVTLGERVPHAAVASPNGAEWIVVAADQHVLETRLTPPTGVPLIVAPDTLLGQARVGEPLEVAASVVELTTSMPVQLEPWVDSWTIDADGIVTAELVGSAKAIFGSTGDRQTQFVSLASILNGGTDLTCIAIIDLHVEDTPVLTRDVNCLVAAASL